MLTIGELWAMPAMLRLGLIESVRRMALRTVQRLDETRGRRRGGARGSHAPPSEGSAGARATMLDRFVRRPPELTPIFVSRFLHQLRLEGVTMPPLRGWSTGSPKRRLSAEEATSRATQPAGADAGRHGQQHHQPARHRADGLEGTSSRRRAAWRRRCARIPPGCYSRMTFATRDRYRHVVEAIAKRTRRPRGGGGPAARWTRARAASQAER